MLARFGAPPFRSVQRFEHERDERTKERDFHEKHRAPPVVDSAERPYSPYQNAKCVFIVRSQSWLTALPVTAPVSISTAEATHERPLGVGSVRPPQIDGKSVVTLDTVYEDADKFIKALLDESTRKDSVAKVRIGPAYNLQGAQPPQTTGNCRERALDSVALERSVQLADLPDGPPEAAIQLSPLSPRRREVDGRAVADVAEDGGVGLARLLRQRTALRIEAHDLFADCRYLLGVQAVGRDAGLVIHGLSPSVAVVTIV